VTVATPFQRQFVVHRLGLAMINLCTNKSLCSPAKMYERQRKMYNFRWFRGYGSPKVTGNVTIRYSAYDFLLDFHRSYASYLDFEL